MVVAVGIRARLPSFVRASRKAAPTGTNPHSDGRLLNGAGAMDVKLAASDENAVVA
jgi:hypothetical protein